MKYRLKTAKFFGSGLIGLLFPKIIFAADITDLINAATDIVSSVLIPLAFALCLLYFFWGVVKYIKEGAMSEKATEEGKRIMVWGIVGLFVVSSVWGMVAFIQSELDLPDVENPSPVNQ